MNTPLTIENPAANGSDERRLALRLSLASAFYFGAVMSFAILTSPGVFLPGTRLLLAALAALGSLGMGLVGYGAALCVFDGRPRRAACLIVLGFILFLGSATQTVNHSWSLRQLGLGWRAATESR